MQTNLTAEATNRTEHTNEIPLSFGFITTLTLVSASPKCRGFLDSFLCTLPTTNTNCNSSTMFNLCCGARRWLKQFEWMTHGSGVRASVRVSVCVCSGSEHFWNNFQLKQLRNVHDTRYCLHIADWILRLRAFLCCITDDFGFVTICRWVNEMSPLRHRIRRHFVSTRNRLKQVGCAI